MRSCIIKCISALCVLCYVQGIILPWAISNNVMPLWADILLIAIIITLWIIAMDRIAIKLISKFKDDINERADQ